MVATTISDSNMGNYYSINKGSYSDKLSRFKVGMFTTPTATTSSDTVAIDLEDNFGIRKLMFFRGFQHITENSVINDEASDDAASTTAVVNNTLTITTNGTAVASKRVYLVYGI